MAAGGRVRAGLRGRPRSRPDCVAGQYSQTVAVARGRTPLYCMPSPGPTHAEFQAAFVAWARANPQYAQERAVEGLSRFTSATYPCPPAQAAARSRTR